MHTLPARIFSLLKAALFALPFALALILILFTNGRILDPWFVAARDTSSITAVSIFCWIMVGIFTVRLAIGCWKDQCNQRRNTSLIVILIMLGLPTLMLLPDTTPEWLKALCMGFVGLVAYLITDRTFPYRKALTEAE